MRVSVCQCGQIARDGQRKCRECHASYMRAWRMTHTLTREQRKKMNARAYAHVYRDRGKLIKEPCRVCGDRDSQMHHPNYDEPLNVVWLCRECHLQHHRNEYSQEN